MTNLSRRGFLGAMLAAAAAPAIVKSDSLMRIVVPKPLLLTLWGDGLHDDAQAIQALINGKSVTFEGREFGLHPGGAVHLPIGTFALGSALVMGDGSMLRGNGARLKATHKWTLIELKPNSKNVVISDLRLDRVPGGGANLLAIRMAEYE